MKTLREWRSLTIYLCTLLLTELAPLPYVQQQTSAHPNHESPVVSVPILRKRASRAQNEEGVQAIRAGNEELAHAAFTRALKYDPENLTAVYNLAGLFLNSDKHEQAIVLLEKYSARIEGNADLAVRLGDAYFTAKRVSDAERAYEKAFSLVPEYPGLPIKLATLYGLKQDFRHSEEMLERASAQTPNDSQLLNNLGNLYILNGKAELAVNVAKQALQIRTSKESYLTLGNAYEALHDYQNSLIAFERARDLGAQSPELTEKIYKLRLSEASG